MSEGMQPGFANHFASEAVPGALPVGRNSPQHVPFGLYAEQLSGTAFTAPRAENRRSWLYRLRPSAAHAAYAPYARPTLLRSGPCDEVPPSPNRLRWNPLPMPEEPADFVDGLVTCASNGDVGAGTTVTALFNWIDADAPVFTIGGVSISDDPGGGLLDQYRYGAVGLQWLHRRNVRLLGEVGWDFANDRARFVTGVVAGF